MSSVQFFKNVLFLFSFISFILLFFINFLNVFLFFLFFLFFKVSINWEAIAAKESKELEDEIENARTGGGGGRGSRK